MRLNSPARREGGVIGGAELKADMLAVTVAAGRLQDAGLINYSRGHITVLNRPGLEATVCECYRVVQNEFERLFG